MAAKVCAAQQHLKTYVTLVLPMQYNYGNYLPLILSVVRKDLHGILGALQCNSCTQMVYA